ncbi:hypothetical protein NC651_036801 [Populus alba x Populus x berolinensis]|nr:hypothetical protein NC651_036801 [Populus alba x Populus x berolinensis]
MRLEAKENHLNLEPASDIENGGLFASREKYSRDALIPLYYHLLNYHILSYLMIQMDKKAEPSTFICGEKSSSEAEPPCLSVRELFPEDSMNGSDFAEKLDGEKKTQKTNIEKGMRVSVKSASMDNEKELSIFTRG